MRENMKTSSLPITGRARRLRCKRFARADETVCGAARDVARPKAADTRVRDADGAFMEPRGCNRLQSAANRTGPETTKQAESVATGCHRLPETFHGKEGVDGSSPSERLCIKVLQKKAFCVAHNGEISILRGCETGTFWNWRALAGTHDVSRHSAGRVGRPGLGCRARKSLQKLNCCCPKWRVREPLLQ